MKKQILIILTVFFVVAGCSKETAENKIAPVDVLKAHLIKNYSSLKISSMAEAFAGLVADPIQRKEIIDEAKAGYAEMKIEEIYLLTGMTAESNESVIGSLIQFHDSMTLEEARAELAKDSNFQNQEFDIYMNKNYAFVAATINGKKVTPQAVINAFNSF